MSLPKVPPKGFYSNIQNEKSHERGAKKKEMSIRKEMPLKPTSEYSSKDFCKYFSDKYKEYFGSYISFGPPQLAHMKRLADLKDNDLLLKSIDAYFNISEFELKSINNFASNFVQTVIDTYIKSGNVPTLIKPSKKDEALEAEKAQIAEDFKLLKGDEDDEW